MSWRTSPLSDWALSGCSKQRVSRFTRLLTPTKQSRYLRGVPDIWAIFTDIDMPGSMDGIRLAHAVRDRWPPVYIFIASGHRTPEEKELPDKALFFSKPYDEASVIATFHTLRVG